ncbi:hypothetical protein F5Y19DRAFT_13910 [Xylariaceae sp. FL1651]|nr:hypothetical protein F5Y19DRAFT_13910 [Xylariaceae sp. FL1651]
MFLHSGASLHGHEFSKRPTQGAAHVGNRRNTLLRSAFAPPVNRASTYPSEAPTSREHEAASDLEKSKALSESASQSPDTTGVRFQRPRPSSLASQSEVMSEDETSMISDSDTSRVSSSVGQNHRSRTRKSTTFVLAHPPPKLRTKQRIIHMRPNLVLQIQQVSFGQRPRPTIDVYPSSAIAGSIIAPFLKRFPRIARTKRELSIQDIMLVKSEDYVAKPPGYENDGDEGDIMTRDLLAILSPSKTEDKAEIVLAEGTVWVATTRANGNSYSYEFTSVDSKGITTTARWVRKQIVSSSLPGTPTSPIAPPTKAQLPDHKFTFSVIDPGCRRHPILATLTSASLSILDTYTTVSPSASRYPPAAPSLPPANSPSQSDQVQAKRQTQPVEEWQKSFIMISAVWVALRHGWAPNFRPGDFMPSCVAIPSTHADTNLHVRRRSLSASAESSPNSLRSEPAGRRKHPIGIRTQGSQPLDELPRRATSTGAAFIQKRKAMQQESDEQPANSEHDRMIKLNRRALSGDWNVGLLKRTRENSSSELVNATPTVSPKDDSEINHTSALAPPPLPTRRRVVSAYSPLNHMSPDLGDFDVPELYETPTDTAYKSLEKGDGNEANARSRHQRWKSMANWFRKISGR